MMMRMDLPRVRYHHDGRRRLLLLSLVVKMLRMWSTVALLLLLLPFSVAAGHPDGVGDGGPSLRLPTFFSHHMVISSHAPSIWGKVEYGQRGNDNDDDDDQQDNDVVVVNVRVIKGRVVSDTDVNVSSQGDWHVQLLPQTPAVGYTITIALMEKQKATTTRDATGAGEGEPRVIDSISLTDVAFGDVFLCAGQSNMEMSIHGVFNASEEILDAFHYPALRMFTAARNMSVSPEWDVPSKSTPYSWTISGTPENMLDDMDPFGAPSAVCYFAGRDIYMALQDDDDIDKDVTTPIGLVIVPWGGMPIEYFSSPTALAQCPSSSSSSSTSFVANTAAAPVDVSDNQDEQGGGDNDNDDNKGSCIWNGMVSAFTKFHFRAALWYQGEANSHDPDNYACRFPAMIADWRQQFASAPTTTTTTTTNLPFYYVQLAPYPHEDYSYIRAAQEAAVMRLPAVYTAVTIDLGDPTSPYGAIHPRRKQTVGQRLAASILYHEYGYRATGDDNNHGGDGPVVRDVSFPEHSNADGTSTIRVTIRAFQHQLHLQGTAACSECCYEWPFTVLDSITGNWTRSAIMAVHVDPDNAIIELILSPDVVGVSAVAGLRYAWDGYPQCVLYDGRGGPDDQLDGGLPVPPFEWCRYPTGQPSWTGKACGLAGRWQRKERPPVTGVGVPPWAGPESDEMAVATE
jgi:sialate O-acetylesterase